MILYSFMHPKNPNDGILEIFGNIGDMVFFSFVLTNFLVVLFLIPLKNFVFYKSLKKHGIRYDKELYKQIQINTLPLYGCIFFFLAYIEGSKSVKLSDFGFAFTTIIAVYVLEFICSRIILKKSQSRRF